MQSKVHQLGTMSSEVIAHSVTLYSESALQVINCVQSHRLIPMIRQLQGFPVMQITSLEIRPIGSQGTQRIEKGLVPSVQ